MPPRIYQSGIISSNIITGRQYLIGADAYIYGVFSPFTSSFVSGTDSLVVDFQPFDASFVIQSGSLDVDFTSFNASFASNSGAISTFSAQFNPFKVTLSSGSLVLSAESQLISISGSCYQIPTISIDVNSLETTIDSEITTSVTIIEPDTESGSDSDVAITFSGDVYVVLNLKTKAHSIYMDGNNNAIAQTGELALGDVSMKNVSDLYLTSRAVGVPEIVIKNNEETERTYSADYGETEQAILKNKKLKLSKKLKGSKWQFSLISSDRDYIEVENVDLIVNKLKRRV